MGSQIVKALIEQRAKQITNPGGVSPEVSHPILQSPFNVVSVAGRIEQVDLSNPGGVSSSSRPVEQVLTASKDLLGGGLLEQQQVSTSILGESRPIEQQVFISSSTTSKIVEQRNISSSLTSSAPVEQTAPVSNTITVEQFNFIDLIFPACGSIRNPVDTNILIRLRDFGFPFNLDTLIFKVEGLEVQDSAGFVITPISNGIQIDYNPPTDFPYEAQIEIFIQILDTATTPHKFIFRCAWFTVPDTIGPLVKNFTLCNTANVDVRAPVEFDVIDRETGVNPNSIQLAIEGIVVCSGIEINELTASGVSGFHVTWSHEDAPFRYGSKVTAAVEAEDNATVPNKVLFVCRFQVEESTPPEFINFNPAPCKTFVDNTTGLKFEVYGVEQGVDISTLDVFVDRERRRVYVRPRIRRVL